MPDDDLFREITMKKNERVNYSENITVNVKIGVAVIKLIKSVPYVCWDIKINGGSRN